MIKLITTIQSFSDIITNSSSEIFCQITGEDLDIINEVLSPIFQGVDDDFEPNNSRGY